MLNNPSPVNFVHVKRIAPACYEARLKFQNAVLTGGPLYTIKSNNDLISVSLASSYFTTINFLATK